MRRRRRGDVRLLEPGVPQTRGGMREAVPSHKRQLAVGCPVAYSRSGRGPCRQQERPRKLPRSRQQQTRRAQSGAMSGGSSDRDGTMMELSLGQRRAREPSRSGSGRAGGREHRSCLPAFRGRVRERGRAGAAAAKARPATASNVKSAGGPERDEGRRTARSVVAGPEPRDETLWRRWA